MSVYRVTMLTGILTHRSTDLKKQRRYSISRERPLPNTDQLINYCTTRPVTTFRFRPCLCPPAIGLVRFWPAARPTMFIPSPPRVDALNSAPNAAADNAVVAAPAAAADPSMWPTVNEPGTAMDTTADPAAVSDSIAVVVGFELYVGMAGRS